MKLPRVQRIRRGDKVLCYHRPTGTRLPDLPETHPEFIAAWARAEATVPDYAPKLDKGSVAMMVRNVRASKRWKGLSTTYKVSLRFHLERIEGAHGSLPVKGLREKHIAADLATLDPNPANASLKCWRLIFAQAKVDNVIETDPSLGIKKAQTKSPGHAAWSQHDVDRFREHWRPGTRQRAAFELLAWTGARVSDAATMCRSHIASDGLLSFRQQKTGGLAHVPWTSPLPAWARAWETEREEVRAIVMATAGFTLLETSLGKSRTVKGLSNFITAAAVAAGVTGKTPHGLRKYRLSAIAESGGSAHAIMAWGGHASLAEAEAYTRAASRKAVVIGAEQEQNAVNELKNTSKR
ncbi:site-specific integrase [Pseudomonas sp. GX19020]|uniref:tyrosine-type recombinase/integrase n=1 Tax=Pseudomonas sp. GX19020 TaxID=2942277 RepID=UPI002018DC72|nr:site-specific integrase [Pseudomonas sp. GX19020]